jgi:hypothetical protein
VASGLLVANHLQRLFVGIVKMRIPGREITPAKRRFREALLGGESKSSISEVKQIGVYKDFCCLQGIELEGNLNVVTTPEYPKIYLKEGRC